MEPTITFLVLNAGSSSLKFAWFEGHDLVNTGHGTVDIDQAADYGTALKKILGDRPGERVSAVGHRIVHGGDRFRAPTMIDDTVCSALKELSELAPLHNPPALALIEAAQKALSDCPHIAIFDTAFFASLPEHRFVYPLPYKWYKTWGIRRFGFHGISYAYITTQAPDILKKPSSDLRLIVCHLGNGCSATAIDGEKAVATTMGFTPMEGLMMGTRSGSVDPGLLLYLQRRKGLSAEDLEDALNHQSGLLGVSGASGDYRKVSEAKASGNPLAALALTMYADRIRSAIGSLATTLGRVDALIFTAGVGEHASDLREEVCRGLESLDLHLDLKKNKAGATNTDLSTAASRIRVYILPTQEELQMAREMVTLLKNKNGASENS